jgi:hypothetical protein
MKTLLIGGAMAALAMATTIAAAQPAPPAPPGVAPGTAPVPMTPPVPPAMHREMHIQFNSDHPMTRAEVAEHVTKLFARLDTNHDGFITKDEVEAVHAKMEAAMMKVGDAQKRVGDVEKRMAERGVFIGDRGAMFDRLDTNHDGNISRQEFMAGKPEMREERVMVMRGPDGTPGAMPPMDGRKMEFRFEDGGPMHHMGGMHMGMDGGFGMHLFEMADTNHDGRVSLAEAQAAALAHFDKADINHDGTISPDEHEQMKKVMRLEHRSS